MSAIRSAERLVARSATGSHTASQIAKLPPADWMSRDDFMHQLALRDFKKAWASWLRRYRWDQYATLTFRRPTSGAVAAHLFRRWVRRLNQRAQRRVDWFVVVEWDRAVGFHLHALVGGTAALTNRELSAAWRWGWTRITRYDPRRGAAAYACKHLAKPSVEHDVSVRLERVCDVE